MRPRAPAPPSAQCPDSGRIGRIAAGTNVPVCRERRAHERCHRHQPHTRSLRCRRRTGSASPGPSRATGPPLVKAATWLTHLEYDWTARSGGTGPAFLDSTTSAIVRYDERGCGMSDWDVGDLSLRAPRRRTSRRSSRRRSLTEPFALLGISQGAAVCIAYAVRHPERVSRMVLCGGYARGALRARRSRGQRCYQAIIDLAEPVGQRQPGVPAGVHVAVHPRRHRRAAALVQRPVPEDDRRRRWPARCCARAPKPTSQRLVPQVRTPTLVVHARDDASRRSPRAACWPREIPGAQFVELDSRNHVLLEHEPAWARFQDAVLEFTGRGGSAAESRLRQRCHRANARRWRCSPKGSATPRSPSGWASARRPCATTSRTCSTSSACGRARRRSSSPAITASRGDRRAGVAVVGSPQKRRGHEMNSRPLGVAVGTPGTGAAYLTTRPQAMRAPASPAGSDFMSSAPA